MTFKGKKQYNSVCKGSDDNDLSLHNKNIFTLVKCTNIIKVLNAEYEFCS